MSRLGSLLVQDGVVDVRVIEEAFQRQVLFGGSLDSALLELEALTDARLDEYLSRSTGFPAGTLALIRQAAPDFPEISVELALQAEVVPVARKGRKVVAFVTDATDQRKLDDIAFRAGVDIEPHVVSEVTFHLAVERVYAVAPPARLEPLAAPRRPLYTSPPRHRTTGPLIAAQAATEERDSPFSVDTPPFDPTPLEVAEAVARLQTASDRDAIIEALVRGFARRAHYAAVFVVQGTRAIGRMCVRGPFADRDLISHTEIALDQPSIFARCIDTRSPVLGPVPDDRNHFRIFADLSRPIPVTALVAPITIRGRVVCLGYLDNATQPLGERCVAEATELATEASHALVRLIARAKAAAFAPEHGHMKRDAVAPPRDVAEETAQPAPQATSATFKQSSSGPMANASPIAAGAATATDEEGRRQTPAKWGVAFDHPSGTPEPIAQAGAASGQWRSPTPDPLAAVQGEIDTASSLVSPGMYSGGAAVTGPSSPSSASASFIDAAPQQHMAMPTPLAEAHASQASPLSQPTHHTTAARRSTPPVVRAFESELFGGPTDSRRRLIAELRRAPAEPEHIEVLQRLRGELGAPDPARRARAAEVLGGFGDVVAVPAMIALLDDIEEVAASTHEGLRAIARDDFGRSRWRWRGWYDRNRDRHRVEWLIDALAHNEPEFRRAAAEDLSRDTGQEFGYDWNGPRTEREQAQKKWQTWWEEVGHNLFRK